MVDTFRRVEAFESSHGGRGWRDETRHGWAKQREAVVGTLSPVEPTRVPVRKAVSAGVGLIRRTRRVMARRSRRVMLGQEG